MAAPFLDTIALHLQLFSYDSFEFCQSRSPLDQLYEQKNTCRLLDMSRCSLFELSNNSKVIIHAHATNEGAEQYVAGKQLKHFGQLGSIRGVVCY